LYKKILGYSDSARWDASNKQFMLQKHFEF
jgi:hypothetical protein